MQTSSQHGLKWQLLFFFSPSNEIAESANSFAFHDFRRSGLIRKQLCGKKMDGNHLHLYAKVYTNLATEQSQRSDGMSKALARKHGNRKYPWHRWMDGRRHTAILGQHFTCEPLNFRRRIDMQSRQSGIPVKIEPFAVGDTEIVFRFIVEPDSEYSAPQTKQGSA